MLWWMPEKWNLFLNWYSNFFKISKTLKIQTQKIIAKNNFWNTSKMLNSYVFMKS